MRGDLCAVCARDGRQLRGRAADSSADGRAHRGGDEHARVGRARRRRPLVGYAYGGPHQKRAAYRFSCEVSVYVEQGRRRAGSGRALYEALFKRLAARGYLMAVAGMTLPNEASVGLHRAMGFEPVGVYRRIGWKLGVWHDVAWVQRALGVEQDPPPEPR